MARKSGALGAARVPPPKSKIIDTLVTTGEGVVEQKPKKLRVTPSDFATIEGYSKYKKQEDFGDLEFMADVMPEFINPVGILGMNPKYFEGKFKSIGSSPSYTAGQYNPESRKMTVFNIDDLEGLESKLSPKNTTIEHEAIHRGMDILREYYNYNDIKERFGEETADFLFIRDLKSNLDAELITEINDSRRKGNPDAQEFINRFFKDRKRIFETTVGDKVERIFEPFTPPELSQQEKFLTKRVDDVLKILPNIEELAKERLYDISMKGDIRVSPTEDARGLPEGSLEKDFYKSSNKGAFSNFINNLRNSFKEFVSKKPDFEETSKQMPKQFNKGGAAMEQQMEMAFMQEGGLRDDGMNKDPISGNEVPSGSLAEEVRDDIPAQLSEGEYVVPADVVRFFGVKFFEDLRMQAKMGLAQMENAGRIGGEPIQESAEIIDAEDEAKIRNMIIGVNKGGVIHAAEGVLTESDIQADAVAKSKDPLGEFGFVGGSLGFPSRAIPTQKTFYHPDGRTYVVRYNADGSLSNPNDAVYTESPWSETPPNIQQIATGTGGDASVFDDREESSNRERESSVSQTTQAFTDMQKARVDADKALEDSYTRLMKNNPTLKLTQSQYSNLPLSAKIGLIPAELGLDVKDSDINAIIKNANNPTGLGKLISALGGGVVGAVANAAKTIFTGIGEALNFESANQTVQQVVDSDSDGLMNKVDRFLLGIRKDNKIQTPQGPVDINSSEGKAAIERIEQNRKDVRDKALETHLKEVENLRVDLQQAEESAGQGDLDTVAQNTAFDQQMQEAQAIARGTSGGGGGNTQSAPFGSGPIGGGGGGVGFSQPDSGPFFVNKGGLASKPKAKAKQKKNTKGLGTKPKAT